MTPLWAPQALRDIEAIRNYIAEDSPRYADLVVARIIGAVERLATFPESGRVVPELGDPVIRELIVDPYRVVYRYRGNAAGVVTVFRSSRAFPTKIPGR